MLDYRRSFLCRAPRDHRWTAAEPIRAARVRLDPLRVEDATEMVGVLAGDDLYTYTGGAPPSEEHLRLRFLNQVSGSSADNTEGWLNWILRRRGDGEAVGTVQATMTDPGMREVELAWVVGRTHQGRGYATEGALAMRDWLLVRGSDRQHAYIHDDNRASQVVARRLGMRPTGSHRDFEMRWELGAA